MDHTQHTLLAGDLATKFAVSMGFQEESLETSFSNSKWENWKENKSCQPNFWTVNLQQKYYEILLKVEQLAYCNRINIHKVDL